MLNRVAFIVMAVVVGFATQADAGIFGSRSGGCPNGQCSVRSYYPTQKVVAQPTQAPKGDVAVAAVEPAAPAVQTTPYVASQSSRRGIFRRWSR